MALAPLLLRRWLAPALLLLLLLLHLAPASASSSGVGHAPPHQQQDEEVQALVEAGRELVDSRRFPEATETLERALDLQPNCPGAQVQLGRALAFQGQYEAAAAKYQQALEADPGFAAAMAALGKLRAFQGRHEEASGEFERALAAVDKGGAEEADVLLGLARLTAQSSRDPDGLRRAEALYRRGLAVTPENEQALFDFGIVLSQLGQHEVCKFDLVWLWILVLDRVPRGVANPPPHCCQPVCTDHDNNRTRMPAFRRPSSSTRP